MTGCLGSDCQPVDSTDISVERRVDGDGCVDQPSIGNGRTYAARSRKGSCTLDGREENQSGRWEEGNNDSYSSRDHRSRPTPTISDKSRNWDYTSTVEEICSGHLILGVKKLIIGDWSEGNDLSRFRGFGFSGLLWRLSRTIDLPKAKSAPKPRKPGKPKLRKKSSRNWKKMKGF